MKRNSFIALVLLTLIGCLTSAHADALSDVKKRMAGRLAAVDKLKATGKVGESNLGYLSARQKLTAKEAPLVKAENNDRKLVYGMIAKKTGEKLAVVGKKRAASLRKSSKKGLWLQDAKGKWYQKR